MIRNAGGSWKVLSTEFKIRWRGIVRESRKNISMEYLSPYPFGSITDFKIRWVGEWG